MALVITALSNPGVSHADPDDGHEDRYNRQFHIPYHRGVFSERRVYVPRHRVERYHRVYPRPAYHPSLHSYAYREDDDALELGLGIAVGALLGYVISDTAHQPHYRHRQTTVVTPTTVRVAQPRVAVRQNVCLQTREYQTQVVIGGRYVDAYGTACLQVDGSWKFGPAIPVPQY